MVSTKDEKLVRSAISTVPTTAYTTANMYLGVQLVTLKVFVMVTYLLEIHLGPKWEKLTVIMMEIWLDTLSGLQLG